MKNSLSYKRKGHYAGYCKARIITFLTLFFVWFMCFSLFLNPVALILLVMIPIAVFIAKYRTYALQTLLYIGSCLILTLLPGLLIIHTSIGNYTESFVSVFYQFDTTGDAMVLGALFNFFCLLIVTIPLTEFLFRKLNNKILASKS